MSGKTFVEIRGIDDVRRALDQVLPREGKALARAMVKDMAGVVALDAQENVTAQGLVDTGDLLGGIRSQQERDEGSTVKATIRARNAFYWRFLERGDGPDGIEHAFFLKAREKMLAQLDRFVVESFVIALAKRLKRVGGR